MRTSLLGLALVMTLSLLGAAAAQNAADEVKETMDVMLERAVVRDADAIGELLHEAFVNIMEPQSGPYDKQRFLDGLRDEGPPEGVKFGEYDVSVYGDVAYLVAPIEFPAGGGPPFTFSIGTVLMKSDDAWQLLAMVFLMSPEDAAQLMGGEADVEPVMRGLETLTRKLMEITDSESFFALCMPEGVSAGPYGPDGAMEVTRIADILPTIADLPETKVVPTATPHQEAHIGFGACLFAVDCDVTMGERSYQAREIVVAAVTADGNEWRILATVEAPLD